MRESERNLLNQIDRCVLAATAPHRPSSSSDERGLNTLYLRRPSSGGGGLGARRDSGVSSPAASDSIESRLKSNHNHSSASPSPSPTTQAAAVQQPPNDPSRARATRIELEAYFLSVCCSYA